MDSQKENEQNKDAALDQLIEVLGLILNAVRELGGSEAQVIHLLNDPNRVKSIAEIIYMGKRPHAAQYLLPVPGCSVQPPRHLPKTKEQQTLFQKLDKDVEAFYSDVTHARVCLSNAHIRFLGELVQKTKAEMLWIKGVGVKTLKEIDDRLELMGLKRGMDVLGWTPPEYF